MADDNEKAEEIIKKRKLAAKGIEPRPDGKPIDPLEDAGSLDIDQDPDEALNFDEKQKRIAERGAVAGLTVRRS